MAKRPFGVPGRNVEARARRDRAESLVDWREPERNAHILDWRERAHEFGLIPVEDSGEETLDPPVIEPAARLIEEEEPEAFDDQPIDEHEPDTIDPDPDAVPSSRLPQEDVDLVRVYLNHIGRRKLLKGAEEQEIGKRIETARGELLYQLACIPAARLTLLNLADAVRNQSAPAAELILLPDGGELKSEKIDPVLRAFKLRSPNVAHAFSTLAAPPGPASTSVNGRSARLKNRLAQPCASCRFGRRSSTT